jgi:hypothetical protein
MPGTRHDPARALFRWWTSLRCIARRLDRDPQRWLQGRWEGQLVDVVWDEDGEMVRVPRPRPAVWQPPDRNRYTHK